MMERAVLIAALGIALSSAPSVSWADASLANAPDTAKYEFLRGSQWYVPTATLPAAAMDLTTGKVVPLIDQTVWDITNYRDGYFWGRTVASFTPPGKAGSQIACSRMLGSVTPDGRILISFVPTDQDTATGAVDGIGTLARSNGGWSFLMQMATGTTSVTAHWSFMAQCKKGEACQSKLPGSKLSLAQFLAQCD